MIRATWFCYPRPRRSASLVWRPTLPKSCFMWVRVNRLSVQMSTVITPEQAKDIIRVNNHAAANYELILSLKPDLRGGLGVG